VGVVIELRCFCVLNPAPSLADGDKNRAVSLMVDEARRCDDHLGQSYLLPQLGLFETAATNTRIAAEGSSERVEFRQSIFFDNAWNHWNAAVQEEQKPRRSSSTIRTTAATADPH
jgi:hypothetical protein